MNHKDHVNLLQKGISEKGGIWADLGSGTGSFTLALADLIGPTGKIYTIDKDHRALKDQEKAMRTNFPTTTVEYKTADFTQRLDLPKLDGIIMANSLHFVRHKDLFSLPSIRSSAVGFCAEQPGRCRDPLRLGWI